MKNIIQIQTTLLLVFFLSLPFALLSQETDEKKKVTVKTVKEVDGKKIVKDTTFFVESEGDVKMVANKFTAAAEGDKPAAAAEGDKPAAEGDKPADGDAPKAAPSSQ